MIDIKFVLNHGLLSATDPEDTAGHQTYSHREMVCVGSGIESRG